MNVVFSSAQHKTRFVYGLNWNQSLNISRLSRHL